MGFNSAFKGLIVEVVALCGPNLILPPMIILTLHSTPCQVRCGDDGLQKLSYG